MKPSNLTATEGKKKTKNKKKRGGWNPFKDSFQKNFHYSSCLVLPWKASFIELPVFDLTWNSTNAKSHFLREN